MRDKTRFLGVFSLAMINAAAIINLNNLPSLVVLGYGLISYLLIAAIFFFLPTALVSAELVTGWPQAGGFYAWVTIAFGPVVGFFAIWLQWIANVIWFPTLISVVVENAFKAFLPNLQHQNVPLFICMIVIFWSLTWINLKGVRESSLISSIGVLLGSILPAVLIVIFALIWIAKKFPVYLHFTFHEMLPPVTHLSDMSILLAMMVTLVGAEMSAVHVGNVNTPRVTYPRAAWISTTLILSVFILTGLSMAVLVPPTKIDLVDGVAQCLRSFAFSVHMPWLVPLLMIFIIVGILTNGSTWILGPSRGLQVAAVNSNFPRLVTRTNKHDVPSNILFLQGAIYTVISSLFIFIPSIASSYWILIALTGELYMAMYFILFLAGIFLRYKYPNVMREYKIPGPWNMGMWLVCILGVVGTVSAFIVAFFSPAQLGNLEGNFYVKFLSISFVVTAVVPFIVFYLYPRVWVGSAIIRRNAGKIKPKSSANQKSRRD